MVIKMVEDLFIYEFLDIYSVEKQLIKVFLCLVCVVENLDLVMVFEMYLEEIQGQIECIDQVVEILGICLKCIKCVVMEGLVEEGKEVIDSIDKGLVCDVVLIGGVQKVEYYEIVFYGIIVVLVKQLGYKDVLLLLLEMLEEEKVIDEKLILLVKGGGNVKVVQVV